MFKPKKRLTASRRRTNSTLRALKKEFKGFLEGTAKLAKVGRKRSRKYTEQGLAARRGKVQVPVQPGQRVRVSKSGEISVTSEAPRQRRDSVAALQDRAEAKLRKNATGIRQATGQLLTEDDVARLRAITAQHPKAVASVLAEAERARERRRLKQFIRRGGEVHGFRDDYENYDEDLDEFPELGYYHDE